MDGMKYPKCNMRDIRGAPPGSVLYGCTADCYKKEAMRLREALEWLISVAGKPSGNPDVNEYAAAYRAAKAALAAGEGG